MAPSDQTGWLCCGVQITTQLSYFHIKSGTVSSCVAIERKAFFVPWPTGYTGSGVAAPSQLYMVLIEKWK